MKLFWKEIINTFQEYRKDVMGIEIGNILA